ncbi:hypothetical protein HIM_00318 [Hirsutella minnesotensis 3608]|nr:hypothetical protein HIM_00318 [Hirsutella minnesotensis 3608]
MHEDSGLDRSMLEQPAEPGHPTGTQHAGTALCKPSPGLLMQESHKYMAQCLPEPSPPVSLQYQEYMQVATQNPGRAAFAAVAGPCPVRGPPNPGCAG